MNGVGHMTGAIFMLKNRKIEIFFKKQLKLQQYCSIILLSAKKQRDKISNKVGIKNGKTEKRSEISQCVFGQACT